MNVSEKVAYLKGLAEGLGVDRETKEGKLFSAIIDVLDDVAVEIAEINENALDIGDELDAISDDLSDVEDCIFGDDDEEDDEDEDNDDDEDECSCGCCCGDEHDDEEYMYAVKCPSCGEEITVDESIIEKGGIACPSCGEELEFELEDEDEEDDGEDKV